MDMRRLSSQGARVKSTVWWRRRVATEEWGMLWLRPQQIQLSLCLLEKPTGGSRERPYRKPTLVAGCESTKVDG